MTTSDTRRSSAAPARWLPALLAIVVLILGAVAQVHAQDLDGLDPDFATRVLVPEPATLLFVGAAGMALFRRRARHRLS
ncbi:MAG: PEP-CTERM sorting domain-containing protein [Planctomycetota bacterium]